MSPYAKFEVVEACSKDGMVHIRSCKSNKYLERTENSSITGGSAYWIIATADKPVEDESKVSCTLFKLIPVDIVANKFGADDVSNPDLTMEIIVADDDGNVVEPVTKREISTFKYDLDKSRVYDTETILLVENSAINRDQNQSTTVDTIALEVFHMKNGNIQVKLISSNKFWRHSPNWIWADSNGIKGIDNDTFFRAFIVDSNTIALLNFGKRLTTEGKTNCLNAA
ncbi:hypothetical protein Goshw_012139, partial [Gossypium schwendimanii]|nr:hypothetical protein [Gossypium schwendimanii]